MSRIIAFYIRNLDAHKLPFSSRDLYYYSYQEYLLAMKRAGAQAFFVTGNDSYQGNGRFKQAWSIDAVSEVANFTPVGEIQADIVFDKGGFEGDDVPVVTDKKLHALLDSKALIYEKFGKYQPASILCHTAEEVVKAMASLKTDMAVIKNPIGSSGKQVYIGLRIELTVPANETYPLLVQEFVDMSEGVPGIAPGVHDLRLLMTGSTVIGATLRQPAPGRLHANVSQGGTEQLLSVDQIPDEVKAIALDIDSQLEDLPRYYAIDFAKGKQGWVLIELNNKPGLFRESTGPLARVFMDKVARYVVDLASAGTKHA